MPCTSWAVWTQGDNSVEQRILYNFVKKLCMKHEESQEELPRLLRRFTVGNQAREVVNGLYLGNDDSKEDRGFQNDGDVLVVRGTRVV